MVLRCSMVDTGSYVVSRSVVQVDISISNSQRRLGELEEGLVVGGGRYVQGTRR